MVVNTKNKMNSSVINSLDSDSYPFISFGGKLSQDIALLNFDFKNLPHSPMNFPTTIFCYINRNLNNFIFLLGSLNH